MSAQTPGKGVAKKVMDREKPMISCLPEAIRADCSIEKNILFCWHHCAWQGSAYTTHRPVGHHQMLFCCLWSIDGITGGGAETGWKLMNPHNFHNSLSAPTLGFILWRGFTNRIIPLVTGRLWFIEGPWKIPSDAVSQNAQNWPIFIHQISIQILDLALKNVNFYPVWDWAYK